ncbi:SDR family oxidoreductase [Opitutales bacterium ASA1]|uniref:SDR family oxidoreductase n=1 Tax=Congregicoccus parvus TaxID=3081749 RepID=UPI002B2FB049|nr:SDR family oxidoreductase [Opitutales bacterium ASA1]
MRPKLLLAGASGLVGSNVARVAARRGWEVHAIVGKHPGSIAGADHILRLDLADESSVQRTTLDLFPDAIVNAAAVSEPTHCDADPVRSAQVNVRLPAALARLAHHLGARFVHLSSEQVFDGSAAPYAPADPLTPVNLYGRQKAEAESAVSTAAPEEAVTLRLPLLAGNSATGTRSLHERLFAAWAAGRRTRLYRDEIRQPCSAANVAEVVVELCERRDLRGVHHWAGAEPVSRLEMGMRIAEAFRLPAELFVEPGLRADHPGGAEQRQADLRLVCSSLAGVLKTRQETFAEIVEHLHVPPPCRDWYRSLG